MNLGGHEWIPSGLTRWGIIVPLIPVAAVFGQTLPTFYAFAFLATAIVVPVVYVLARWVVATGVAALAVVTFVAMPLTFLNLSRGYPDLMAIALNGLTLILVLRARDTDRVGPLLLAGLVAGWAFEVRETTVFTWPVFAVLIWGLSRRWLGYAAVIVGLLPWAVLDLGLSWWTLNDPLAKWHVLTGSDLNDSTSPLDGSYLGQQRWWYLTRLPLAMAQESWGWVLLVVCGLGVLGGIVLRGRVGLYVIWALFPALLLVLQAGVLDPQHPSVRVDVPRYWLAFLPGLTIAAVALCAAAAERVRLPAWLGAAQRWPRSWSSRGSGSPRPSPRCIPTAEACPMRWWRTCRWARRSTPMAARCGFSRSIAVTSPWTSATSPAAAMAGRSPVSTS
jgi:4-amino-4-deoxy-L-arabinose transferase-like glycosyltransferase